MDPDSVKSTLSTLAFGNVIAAAARDYQKELLSNDKAATSSYANEVVDLDELMDDPELEKLHADRIASLRKEAEKRQELKKKGHGEYREITEGDFLGEVTGSEKNDLSLLPSEFYRCKIMDKHLKSLAPKHFDTKFLKLDAENAPFFVTKLGIKTLPCVIFFQIGWLGFRSWEERTISPQKHWRPFVKKGMIKENKQDDDERDDDNQRRSVRSSVNPDSDSD